MRPALPNYAAVVAPVQSCLHHVARKANSSTKKTVNRILLSDVGWGETESAALARSKYILYNAMKLARPRSDRQMCLLSDVSNGRACRPAWVLERSLRLYMRI